MEVAEYLFSQRAVNDCQHRVKTLIENHETKETISAAVNEQQGAQQSMDTMLIHATAEERERVSIFQADQSANPAFSTGE